MDCLTLILPNLQSKIPTAQEDSPAFQAIATFQQSIPSHTKAINGLHWSYARKIICWTTHPQSCVVFFCFFAFFSPLFFCSFGVVSAVVPFFLFSGFGLDFPELLFLFFPGAKDLSNLSTPMSSSSENISKFSQNH